MLIDTMTGARVELKQRQEANNSNVVTMVGGANADVSPSPFTGPVTIDFDVTHGVFLGPLIIDGDADSTDIPNVDVEFFLADDQGAPTNATMYYNHVDNHEGLSNDSQYAHDIDTLVVRSSGGQLFDFNGFKASNWGLVQTELTITGYVNGVTTGYETVTLGAGDATVFGLSDDIFGAVDMVVIGDVTGGATVWASFDQFQFDAPVIPDSTAPLFASATVNGNTLVLTYTEANALDATNGPAAGDFAVVAGGAAVTVDSAVVDSDLNTVTLTLAAPVAAGQVVSVAYGDPTGGNDANAIQDTAGNDALSLNATAVTNNTLAPTIVSATYNAANGLLVLNGSNLSDNADIDLADLVLTGEGGETYRLTSSGASVSGGSASAALNGTDRAALNQILNKNGGFSTGGTAFNLAVDSGWTPGGSGDMINAVTVSNVAVPSIASATWDAASGVLAVSGSGFVKAAGAANDIVANKFTLTGEGGATYTLTDSANVEISSATSFSITASSTDRAGIALLLNQDGTSSTGGTTYNLAAAENWAAGADPAVVVADLTGNGVTVSLEADVIAPVFGTASVSGATLVMNYTEAGTLDAGHGPAAGAFAVTAGGASVTVDSVAVDAAARTVTLTLAAPVTAGQTVTVAYTDPSGGNDVNAIQDAAGNDAATLAAHSVTNNTADSGAPEVASIVRQTPTAAATNADTLVYRVRFSEAVQNLDAADFSVSGTTATVTSVTGAGPNAYDLTVSGGDLATLNGAVTLAFANGQDIADMGGNALVALTPQGANQVTYNVDNSAPGVAAIERHDPASETTNADSLVFRVTFSEAVSNLDAADFVASGTTATVTGLAAAGPNAWDVTLSGGNLATLNGTVGLGFAPGQNVQDAAGNALAPVPTGANAAYIVNNLGPATTIATAAFSLDTGASDADFITRRAEQTISGTLSAPLALGESVSVSLDGGVTWTAAAATVGQDTWALAGQTISGANFLRVKVVDAMNNAGPVFSQTYLLDTTAPVFAAATVNAHKLVLAYTDSSKLDAVHPPAPGAFSVKVDGQDAAVSSVAVDSNARTVTLTLAAAVTGAQSVTVAYADPTPSDDDAVIADLAGNDAATLAPTAATNNTPAGGGGTTPPPGPSTIDGVTVQTGTVANPDGSVSTTITIPVVQPNRAEQVGNNAVADIPLLSSGGSPVLLAQVPTGLGLNAAGAGIKTAGTSLTDLIREIQARTTAGSEDRADLTGGGSGFLQDLPANTPLLVQTIVPTAPAGAGAPTQPLTIAGSPQAPGDPLTALVIDARGLPAGSQLLLQNVEFAAIIGAANVGGGAGAQHVWGDSAAQSIVLGEGDDVLHGGGGNDTVGSSAGDDRIFGDAGDDLVFGGSGNDWVDGGSGRDTASLNSSVTAYSYRIADGQLVATDRVGVDGVDTIAGVERLQFAGGSASADTVSTIARLYDILFGRTPDQPGAAFWEHAVEQGASLADVAAQLVGSEEGQAYANLTDAQFVGALYQRALGRSGSAAEASWWVDQLASGRSDRGDVLLGFANSAERLQGEGSRTLTVDFNDSDIATIVRLYDVLFDRRPDEEGINYWLERREDGMSMHDIAADFFKSTEAQLRYGGKDNADFARLVLENAFEQSAAPADVARWADLLDTSVVDHAMLLIGVAGSEQLADLVGVNTSIPTL